MIGKTEPVGRGRTGMLAPQLAEGGLLAGSTVSVRIKIALQVGC